MESRPARNAPPASSALSGGSAAAPTAAPSITLPRGGGAIRGIGEKFGANPVTGTASMSVPVVSSPGRSGFGPDLSLSYDSGSGNGPFGFGWNLALPSVSRKTEKGLPRYEDAVDSDVFMLSGAEDLVPVYRQDPDGAWIAAHAGYTRDADESWVRDGGGALVPHEDDVDGYRVRRYRPRVEGLFARIERWSRIDGPTDVYWRTISRDNVLTFYGHDGNARITDPLDGRRIFSWLICETRDDKGNAVFYRYKAEDGRGLDLTRTHERNRGVRGDPRRTTQRYLKRIHYGNRTPLLDTSGRRPRVLTQSQIDGAIENAGSMFEIVFDYGDHDPTNPAPNDDDATDAAGAERFPWPVRADPFSSYRAGFEVRTARLCRRVLMFHHFPAQDDVGRDCLVRPTDFNYTVDADPAGAARPVYTFLRAVEQAGYRRRTNGYDRRSLPPLEFECSEPPRSLIGSITHSAKVICVTMTPPL